MRNNGAILNDLAWLKLSQKQRPGGVALFHIAANGSVTVIGIAIPAPIQTGIVRADVNALAAAAGRALALSFFQRKLSAGNAFDAARIDAASWFNAVGG